jgi:hypothetical protein
MQRIDPIQLQETSQRQRGTDRNGPQKSVQATGIRFEGIDTKDSSATAAVVDRARQQVAGARLHTFVSVVIEPFTFLDRNAKRDVALTWVCV